MLVGEESSPETAGPELPHIFAVPQDQHTDLPSPPPPLPLVPPPPPPSPPPPLLPPPPPPPPPVCRNDLTQAASRRKGILSDLEDNLSSTSESELAKKVLKNLHLQGSLPTDHFSTFLSCNNPVIPVLQNGPVCGLVALSMASQLTEEKSVTTDEIFEEAHKKGYSKQGEMFSCANFQGLCSHFLPCPIELLHINERQSSDRPIADEKQLIKHLLQRNILLVPYDADKNHSPCQKKGHKAHWALITGLLVIFPSSKEIPSQLLSACSSDCEQSELLLWPEDPTPESCEDMAAYIATRLCKHATRLCDGLNTTELTSGSGCRVFVLAQQGKSKHVGVWELQDLLLSNSQLTEAGPERHEEDYVLPPAGVLGGLKSQALVVKRKRLESC